MITIDKARLRELAEKAKQGGYVSESELAYALRDPATVLALLDAYEALQAECEKLRKDAARYQWLRAHFGRFSEHYDGGSDRVSKIAVNPEGWDVDPGSLDEAIDAAMQENKP